MARLHDIVIDCARPAALARFWAAALDGYAVAPYDEAELARLRARGIAGPEDDPTVLVEPRDGGPRVWCQLVPETGRGKNRVHLDLTCPDTGSAAELARLTGLGATRLADHDDHWVLADPEGNEFCLFPVGA
ncbi:VOC family protein [Streptomyces sp. KL116D]|uniref:VOC family protein n=1 Tax=Streptomyces sp. KL116D TaxID=3045152 RepID=UPI00355728B3